MTPENPPNSEFIAICSKFRIGGWGGAVAGMKWWLWGGISAKKWDCLL